GLMLGNEGFMAALPKAEPVDVQQIAVAQGNNAATEKDFNLSVLRTKHRNEAAARNRRIDIMIGLDESLAGPGMPAGIGKKAFVDLMCWVNGMRTEADIERRGRKHIDGCVKPFLVCDKLAE